MARRMSRFIHFAMGAGKEAVRDSGIDFAAMTPGAARPGRRRRQHRRRRDRADHRRDPRPRPEGPALRQPVRRAGPVGLDGRLHAVDGVRPDRPGHDPGRRLRDLGHRLPRRAPADPRRRVRRRPDRRLRGADLADGRGRAGQHDRAVASATTTRPRPRGRSTARATGSCSARAAGVVVVESLAHARERGATPLAEVIGGALTADAFHISAPEPTGRGQSPGDDLGPAQRRRRAGRDRLHRRPRHRDASSTT